MAINIALPEELYFNMLIKKQEELGEKQKEERLERGNFKSWRERTEESHGGAEHLGVSGWSLWTPLSPSPLRPRLSPLRPRFPCPLSSLGHREDSVLWDSTVCTHPYVSLPFSW